MSVLLQLHLLVNPCLCTELRGAELRTEGYCVLRTVSGLSVSFFTLTDSTLPGGFIGKPLLTSSLLWELLSPPGYSAYKWGS